MDQLLVARMLESISTATTALVSLVELLDKVKNMVISDVIQQEVTTPLTTPPNYPLTVHCTGGFLTEQSTGGKTINQDFLKNVVDSW